MRLATAEDKEAERRIGHYLARLWDWQVKQVSDYFAPYDLTFRCDGQVVAIAEVKVRTEPRNTFPTFRIGQAKVAGLLQAKDALPLVYGLVPPAAYIVVRYPDPALVVAEVDGLRAAPAWIDRRKPRAGGGTARGDSEPAWDIGHDQFEVVG